MNCHRCQEPIPEDVVRKALQNANIMGFLEPIIICPECDQKKPDNDDVHNWVDGGYIQPDEN